MQTVNTMYYLFAAYTAVWVILAVYLFSIRSREKKLQQELQSLRQLVEQQAAKR
jgi:CcmD family protein